jgi:hypothetical protein
MCDVYELLQGPVINPAVLRDAILKSKDAGAVWDGSVYALIDRIIACDPAVWIASFA